MLLFGHITPALSAQSHYLAVHKAARTYNSAGWMQIRALA
jgi:hypothetical protein